MQLKPEQETELLTQMLAFRNDPLGCVHYSFPWGEKGTLFESFKGPRAWQFDDIKRLGDHVLENEFRGENGLPYKVYKEARSSGRGPGKTAKFSMIAHWFMSTRIGAPVVCTANTENQLRNKFFAEMGVWFGAALNAHWFTVESMKITPQGWLTQLVKRPVAQGGLGVDPKYWFAVGQTWNEDNPNAFAGYHNPYGFMLLFDEAAGIPASIWDVSEGFFTEMNAYRFWFAASQMRSRKGRFYDIFYDAKQSVGWDARTMSTRNMEGVDPVVVAEQIARYGEKSDFVRVEIDGLPPLTEEGQFIPYENFREAMSNKFDTGYVPGERLILGVDPAPRGRSTWQFRAGRNARDCCGAATAGMLKGADNVEIANKILELDRVYKPDAICIDFGMGTGVIDILKRKLPHPRILHEVRFGMTTDKEDEYATHGTRLWADVRDWLPGGMIPPDDGSKGTLSYEGTNRTWKWSGQEDNKKILEKKEDMRKRNVDSPDKMDALACTMEVKNPAKRPADDSRGVRVAVGGGDYEFTI